MQCCCQFCISCLFNFELVCEYLDCGLVLPQLDFAQQSFAVVCFKSCNWGKSATGIMPTFWVAEPFNVVKHISAAFFPRSVSPAYDAFALQ